jgi:hypothetical protein
MNKTMSLIFTAIPQTLAAMSFSYGLYMYAAGSNGSDFIVGNVLLALAAICYVLEDRIPLIPITTSLVCVSPRHSCFRPNSPTATSSSRHAPSSGSERSASPCSLSSLSSSPERPRQAQLKPAAELARSPRRSPPVCPQKANHEPGILTPEIRFPP